MRKFELNIFYKSGDLYWHEGFESKRELNDWLKAEEKKFYWKKDFRVEITDNSKAIEEAEAARAAAEVERAQKRDALRARLVELKNKKGKKIDDAIEALDKIIEYLGLEQ